MTNPAVVALNTKIVVTNPVPQVWVKVLKADLHRHEKSSAASGTVEPHSAWSGYAQRLQEAQYDFKPSIGDPDNNPLDRCGSLTPSCGTSHTVFPCSLVREGISAVHLLCATPMLVS
jgi:hypothetical protein